jgi:hypothetical protein
VLFARFVTVTSFSNAESGVLPAGFLAGAASVCEFEKVSEAGGAAADVLGEAAGADGFALGFKICGAVTGAGAACICVLSGDVLLPWILDQPK